MRDYRTKKEDLLHPYSFGKINGPHVVNEKVALPPDCASTLAVHLVRIGVPKDHKVHEDLRERYAVFGITYRA